MSDENKNEPAQHAVSALVEWLTIAEAAELIRMDVKTVYVLADTGKLPGAKRFGRTWRVRRAELEAPQKHMPNAQSARAPKTMRVGKG